MIDDMMAGLTEHLTVDKAPVTLLAAAFAGSARGQSESLILATCPIERLSTRLMQVWKLGEPSTTYLGDTRNPCARIHARMSNLVFSWCELKIAPTDENKAPWAGQVFHNKRKLAEDGTATANNLGDHKSSQWITVKICGPLILAWSKIPTHELPTG